MAYKFQMGEAILSGSTTFEEALAGLDTLDVSGQLSGAADLKIGGAAQVAGQVDLAGDLNVAQDADIDGGLDVAVSIHSQDTLSADGVTSLNALNILNSEKITASGDLELAGNADLNGQLDVQVSIHSQDTLSADGQTTLGGQVEITNASLLSGSGDFQLAGNATLNASLDVVDDVVMQADLEVGGEATLASAIVEDLSAGRVPFISGSGALVDAAKFNVQPFGPNPMVVVGDGTFGGALSASVQGPGMSLWFNNSANPYAFLNAGEFNFNNDFIARSDLSTFETSYDTTIDATLTLNDDLQVNADGEITGQLQVNGPITASSHVKVQGLLSGNAGYFAGNFALDGNLHANAPATFYSTLHVDGGATVNQLQVEDLTNADGGIVWSDASGDLFDNTNFKYLHASNELQVVSGKVSASLLQLASNADIAGQINVVGNIMGDGLLNVQNHVSSAANLMAGANLMVAGFAAIDGDLTALGTSNLVVLTASADSVFEQDLHVMGDLDIDGDIIFNGDLEVDGDFQVDGAVTFTNVAGTMDIAADSMYFLDDTDGQLKSYSWSTLMSDIAGAGLTATAGVLSTDAAATPVAWTDGAGLVEGINYITADTAVDFSGTLPSAPSVGDRVICKAKGVSGGAQVKIMIDGGVSPTHRIDGSETEAIIESPYGAITLVYVAADDWRIL